MILRKFITLFKSALRYKFASMRFTLSYTVLFLYVISAIVWWGYSHFLKSDEIYALEKSKIELLQEVHPNKDYTADFEQAKKKLNTEYAQYWGEGLTFLIVILVSAVFVYRAFYKQLQLTKLQRNFMMSVTHELKTPLAGVILNLQTMLRRKIEPEIQDKLLRSSEREAKRLSSLCNNILVSTQLEDGGRKLYTSSCDLGEVAMQAAEDFMETIEQRELQVDFALENSYTIKGDASLWKLVVSNLLQNAHKYSALERPIILKLLHENNKLKLQVIDEGIGIADDEKKLIFGKFYRTGNESTRQSQGTGVGLYLVKKVVELFKNDISVRNNEPAGSIFEIVFRTAPNS